MMDRLIKNMIDSKLSNVHTCLVCKVLNLSPLQVKPNYKRDLLGEQQEYPVLEVKMLGGWKTVTGQEVILDIKVGDDAVVLFSERAIDNAGTRKFDLADGIIIGVLN